MCARLSRSWLPYSMGCKGLDDTIVENLFEKGRSARPCRDGRKCDSSYPSTTEIASSGLELASGSRRLALPGAGRLGQADVRKARCGTRVPNKSPGVRVADWTCSSPLGLACPLAGAISQCS